MRDSIPRCARLSMLVLCLAVSGARGEEAGNRDPMVLRVGSQNLLHDFPKFHKVHARLAHAAKEIRRLNLDIVGLQESAWIAGIGLVPKKIADRLGYHYAFFKLERAGFVLGFENGISIVSRYPIVEQELRAFEFQKNIFEARAVMRALIATPLGPVNFYSAHLSGASDRLNLRQARELVAFIESHQATGIAILAGDFNFHEVGSAQRYLASAGFLDTFAVANPGRNEGSCCTCIEASYSNWFDSCPTRPFRRADDRLYLVTGIATRGEIVASDFMMAAPFKHDGRWLWVSDHRGIESAVRLSPRPTDDDRFASNDAR